MPIEPHRRVVYRLNLDAEPDAPMGAVELDAEGRLLVVDAEPGCLEYLDDMAAAMNARETLVRKAPGADRSAIGFEEVPRDAPDLLDALIEAIERYHGVTLITDDPKLEPSTYADL
ncbi:MAG: hypothetical protein H6739_38665 [Alphaproteobacteria bacterium]|nr:hypothetical protein [Alphaproteobacteria bacterium]